MSCRASRGAYGENIRLRNVQAVRCEEAGNERQSIRSGIGGHAYSPAGAPILDTHPNFAILRLAVQNACYQRDAGRIEFVERVTPL